MALRDAINELSVAFGDEVQVESCASGRSNNVYIIVGKSGTRRSLRIPTDALAAVPAKRGVALLKQIKLLRPSLQVPDVVYEASDFTVLSYVDGSPLGSWSIQSVDQVKRIRLLDGLASFLFELWTFPTNCIPANDRPVTYREWVLSEVDKGLCRSLENSSWGKPIHFLSRRAQVSRIIPDTDDPSIAIKHGDLNAWNVITHEDAISGIIDWDTAQLVPLPAAIQHPLFIADIPGWKNDDVPEGMTFGRDREYLEEAVRKLATSSESPAAERVLPLLEGSFERQFFELSLRNKEINKEYIRGRLTNNKTDMDTALEQLDAFLCSNVAMAKHPGISRLRNDLLSFIHESAD